MTELPAKPSKYRNEKTEVDGIKFASKREAKRYGELKLLQRAGAICDLQIQPKFPLEVNGAKVCLYIGDFSYRASGGPPGGGVAGELVVEDAKGFKTPAYRLKAKLFEALFGFPIREI